MNEQGSQRMHVVSKKDSMNSFPHLLRRNCGLKDVLGNFQVRLKGTK